MSGPPLNDAASGANPRPSDCIIHYPSRVCLVFGDCASRIEIAISADGIAHVRMECRRALAPCLLDERERKLLRLALDKSVEPNELRNAAESLIKSWRTRGICVEDFDKNSETLRIDSYGSRIIGFGRYEGQRVGDLPRDYLRWLSETDSIKNRYPDIAQAASAVLKRGMAR
jgi:hypothetical protein